MKDVIIKVLERVRRVCKEEGTQLSDSSSSSARL